MATISDTMKVVLSIDPEDRALLEALRKIDCHHVEEREQLHARVKQLEELVLEERQACALICRAADQHALADEMLKRGLP